MPCDYDDYPDDWHDLSREIRFDRADGECEECGAAHGEPHPVTGSEVVLTVAHLDHDTTNNDPDNLRAMCQRCHLTYDAPYHTRSRKYGRKHREVNYELDL